MATSIIENEFSKAYVVERSSKEVVEGFEAIEEELWVVKQKLRLLEDYPERKKFLNGVRKDNFFAKWHEDKLTNGLSSNYEPFEPLPIHDLLLWLYAGLVRKEGNLLRRRSYFSTLLS